MEEALDLKVQSGCSIIALYVDELPDSMSLMEIYCRVH